MHLEQGSPLGSAAGAVEWTGGGGGGGGVVKFGVIVVAREQSNAKESCFIIHK